MITGKISVAASGDAELVANSLAGDREAFRQIVERHQTLVCSLAYCATGSLTQSEDLAQETFLAAWRQLAGLREPAKLRPWLCGIARFVIGKELRRQGREPLHAAETMETMNELPAPGPLPSDRVINKEEQAILWHCVARIPEIYREPGVLFYREHQSVGLVAEALELSEDAVKQRLARGRKLLQEEALAYVEGALQSTNPGHAFTAGVLAAVPLSAAPAKVLAAGATVKGSSAVKTIASIGAVGAIVLYWSVLSFLAFVGGCTGYWMSRACANSSRQCENIIRFWRAVAWGFAAAFIIRPCWLYFGRGPTSSWGWFIWIFCEHLFYVIVVAALAMWIRRWWLDLRQEPTGTEPLSTALKRRVLFWLSLGMIGPVLLFAPIPGALLWQAFGPPTKQYLSDAQAQKLMAERKDASFWILQELDGRKVLHIDLPENDPNSKVWARRHIPAFAEVWTGKDNHGNWLTYLIYWSGYRPVQLLAVANAPTLKVLDEMKIHYGTGHVVDSSREAWPFGSLLPFFIAPMGAVILLRGIGKGRWPMGTLEITEAPQQESGYGKMLLSLGTDAKARKVFGIAFAMTFLLVFGANAFAATKIFTWAGLYIVLFLGSIKAAFFGLIAGAGILCLRTRRKMPSAG